MLELALLAALVTGQADEDAPPPAEDWVETDVDIGSSQSAGTYDYAFANTHKADVGGGLTRVSVLSQFPTPSYGYFPLVANIDNTLGPRQTVRISFSTNGAGGSHTFSRSVEVEAGERRSVTVPVISHLRYGNVRVRGPGITDNGETHVYFNQVSPKQRAVLNIGSADEFSQKAGAKPSFSSSSDVQVVNIAPDEAPGELTPYIGWDTVVVSGAKLETLTDAQRRALEGYAALGGHLVLMQSSRGITSSFPLLQADLGSYGLGELTFCDGCGIERVLQHKAVVPVRAIEPKGRRNRYAYADDGVPELALPVAVAPIGRFLLIITAFTLAIGPGSLWVARKKGPAALLITIPGTAAVTCMLIVGYSLFRDGFTVHSTVQGFTFLDSGSRRAITSSVGAFYANLAPGGARFGTDAVIVAPFNSREYGGVEQATSINFDEGAKLGADFVPSRSYLEWTFLSITPTRARLVVKHEGGTVRVQNALGSTIDYAQLRTKDGLYTVTSLKDGEEKVAEKDPRSRPPDIGILDKRLSPDARTRLSTRLREGEFFAALQGPGFTQLGGLRLEHSDSRHLVRGGWEK